MARLPHPGGDSGNWGDVLNDYLSQALKPDGSIKDNAITANTIAPNSITASKIASDSIGAAAIANNSISENLLDSAVRAKLNTAMAPSSGLSESDVIGLINDPSSDLRQALDVLYATGSSGGNPNSPKASYDFHEGSGHAADLMGNFPDLVPSAYSGQALSASAEWDSPVTAFSAYGTWTICYDVYLASFSGTSYTYFTVLGGSGGTSYVYANNHGGNGTFAYYSQNTGEIKNAGADLTIGTHQIVVTSDGTEVRLYIDGAGTANGSGDPGTPNTFSTVADDGSWPAGDLITTLRIWDSCLTPTQVAALYA